MKNTDNVTIATDHTLYARWEAKTVIVSFDANGGSVSTSSKTVTINQKYGSLPTPSRSSYDFNGWYTSRSGGSYITSNTTVTTKTNHTLYAHWKLSPTPTPTSTPTPTPTSSEGGNTGGGSTSCSRCHGSGRIAAELEVVSSYNTGSPCSCGGSDLYLEKRCTGCGSTYSNSHATCIVCGGSWGPWERKHSSCTVDCPDC